MSVSIHFWTINRLFPHVLFIGQEYKGGIPLHNAGYNFYSTRKEHSFTFFDYRFLSILSSVGEFFFFNFSLFVFIHGIIDLFQKIIYCFTLTIVGAVTKRKLQLIRFFS